MSGPWATATEPRLEERGNDDRGPATIGAEPREKERTDVCESAAALKRREEEHGEGPATHCDDDGPSASSDAAAEEGARR
jgi:hypothetical protein